MKSRMTALLLAALAGVSTFAAAGPAFAAPNVGENPPWSVWNRPHYNLPANTKVEWIYAQGSGHCFQGLTSSQVYRVDIVGQPDADAERAMFTTYDSKVLESCTYSKSYGTWQVRITTPTNVVKTGSLYFTTGSPNALFHYGEVSCHDFSYITCIGDSETVMPPFVKNPTVDVTLGPITTGTPSLPGVPSIPSIPGAPGGGPPFGS